VTVRRSLPILLAFGTLVAGCRKEPDAPRPPAPATDSVQASADTVDPRDADPVVRMVAQWSRNLQTALDVRLSEIRSLPIGRERDSGLLELARTWDRYETVDSMVGWINGEPAVLGAMYPADQDSSRRLRIEWWLRQAGLIHDVVEGEFFALPHLGARMDLFEDILTPSTRAFLLYRASADRLPLTNQEGVELPLDSLPERILALETIHRIHEGTVAADEARQEALLLVQYLWGQEHDPSFDAESRAQPVYLACWRRLASEPFDSPIHEAMVEWIEALDAAGGEDSPVLQALRSRLENRLEALRR